MTITNGEGGASVRAKINQAFSDIQTLSSTTAGQTSHILTLQSDAAKVFSDVASLLADAALGYSQPTPNQVVAGNIIYAGGFRYEVALAGASDQHLTTAGGVKLYAMMGADGALNSRAYATASKGLTADNTADVQRALDNFSTTIIDQSLRIDGTIEVPQSKALLLKAGVQLTRTTDVANTDPVVWLRSNHSSLMGEGTGTLVRSFNASPLGVVRLGHRNMTESHGDVLYCTIKDIAIYGRQQFGATSGDPDIALYMPNPQIGGRASYFHQAHNVLFANCNIGIKFHGNANANTMTQLQFLRLGGNNVGVENACLYFDGGKENMISHFFLHFSPNARTIYFTQDFGVNVELNRIENWVAEPGIGETAKGLVVNKCHIGNVVRGILNGITNDYGAADSGWYSSPSGSNRRNLWEGLNEIIWQTALTVRRPSPSIELIGSDTSGGDIAIFATGNTTTPIALFRANPGGTNENMWEMVGNSGAFRPADDNVRDIGQSVRQVRNVWVGTQVLVDGKKVLSTQQGAIANAGAGTEVATINSILAALRAHGLIAT